MKYFINGKEIKFGDEFFVVKECKFDGIESTTTFEGTFTPECVDNLVDLHVVETKPCNDKEDKCLKELFDELDKNIQLIEEMADVLKKNIG